MEINAGELCEYISNFVLAVHFEGMRRNGLITFGKIAITREVDFKLTPKGEALMHEQESFNKLSSKIREFFDSHEM